MLLHKVSWVTVQASSMALNRFWAAGMGGRALKLFVNTYMWISYLKAESHLRYLQGRHPLLKQLLQIPMTMNREKELIETHFPRSKASDLLQVTIFTWGTSWLRTEFWQSKESRVSSSGVGAAEAHARTGDFPTRLLSEGPDAKLSEMSCNSLFFHFPFLDIPRPTKQGSKIYLSYMTAENTSADKAWGLLFINLLILQLFLSIAAGWSRFHSFLNWKLTISWKQQILSTTWWFPMERFLLCHQPTTYVHSREKPPSSHNLNQIRTEALYWYVNGTQFTTIHSRSISAIEQINHTSCRRRKVPPQALHT